MQPAARMSDIEPFYVMAILERARALEAQGRDVVHMEIGEPDFATAEPIVAAGQAALASGLTHYTPALGLPPLREAVAGFYARDFSLSLDASRIGITPGASGALQLLLGALVGPGDEVLLADPGYPCNRHFVRLFEGVPKPVAVDERCGFQLTRDLLEAAAGPRCKAVVLASPSNPTGTSLSEEALVAILTWAAERGVYVVVDEIYSSLVYGRAPRSVLQLPHSLDDALAEAVSARLFVVNSFSKYFGMTGWRLGWFVAPQEWMWTLDKLAQNLFLAPPTPSQYAALAAFEEPTRALLEQRRLRFAQRREALLSALSGLEPRGLKLPSVGDGAFYLYLDVGALGMPSDVLAMRLLEEASLAVTPGRDFGEHRSDQFVRLAFTQPRARLLEGVERLEKLVASL